MSYCELNRILVVNRGEIAVRIIKTIQEMGKQAYLICSEPDAQSLASELADVVIPLRGSSASETYLNQEVIFAIAQEYQIEAIHPGFGFLSENADFAQACEQAGIVFIGPSPAAIEAMGDKIASKQKMEEAGVPVVPSTTAIENIESIGFPLLVKASAGGGGKGMRLVSNREELDSAIDRAENEALKAFGDKTIFFEKYIENPRHIEIQVFGDHHGHIVHFGERECSIQRRYQKVIEEAPSSFLTSDLRKEMGEAAVCAARALNYVGAGTVEFIVGESGEFYFLEMNTRLQVEHPVTELIYGIDLVELQILVEEGAPLLFDQEDIEPMGWAMEARVYAEDPYTNFLPATGLLQRVDFPVDIRVDTGIQEGDKVTVFYDPMLAKVIAHGADRDTATKALVRALQDTTILGLKHNVDFLLQILSHSDYQKGAINTGFLAENSFVHPVSQSSRVLALVAAYILQAENPPVIGNPWLHVRLAQEESRLIKWRAESGKEWVTSRLVIGTSFFLDDGERMYRVDFSPELNLLSCQSRSLSLADVARFQDQWWFRTSEGHVQLTIASLTPERALENDGYSMQGGLQSSMPGTILEVYVVKGDKVQAGQVLLVMESMKMELEVQASGSGVVESIFVQPGETVQEGQELIKVVDESEG